MWLKKTFWYLLLLLKYWVIAGIVTAVIAAFFPSASLIAGGLVVIGSFSAALTEYREKVIPRLASRLEQKQLERMLKKHKHEFEGFDEMARTIQRGI